MAEPKHVDRDLGKQELYHNAGSPASGQVLPTTLTLNDSSIFPSQGVGDQDRVGDQIYGKGFKIRMMFGLKQDRHNVTFRLFVCKNSQSQQPSTYNTLFDAATNNVLLDTIDTDRVKVVYHKYIKPKLHPDLSGAGGADKEYTFVRKIWLPFKKLIKFNQDGGLVGTGTDPQYTMYIAAFDAYGTLLTDNIAYVQVYQRFYFADP